MMDSWGILKVSGDLHPKRLQVCTLHQKEFEIKKITVKYSDTSAKSQYLYIGLDDRTLLAELNLNANISDLNVSSVTATMRDNGGVDAATLAYLKLHTRYILRWHLE
jgi:ABC-type proline/glycine betaine transport system substrate-binding protein